MNSFRQLLRQPIRSFMGIIALTLSGTILCLSVSLYYSAVMTAKESDSIYTTIALPKEHTEIEYVQEDGVTHIIKNHTVSKEIRDWINSMPSLYKEVLGIYHQQLISGYSDGLNTLVSAMEDMAYSYHRDLPYTNAAFVITIESIDNDSEFGTVEFSAKINRVLLLHQGYKVPEGYLRITYNYSTEEELKKADLRIGDSYLVFGSNYTDTDLTLKKRLAEILKISSNDIDWSNINYDITEYLQGLKPEDAKKAEDIAALYEYNGHSIPITNTDLRYISSSWMFVQNPANFIMSTFIYPDGTTETVRASEEMIKAKTLPTITRLTTDPDTFLNSEEGKLFRETIEQYKITNQSVPVIGTDLLECIFEFHQNRAYVVKGRSFTEDEYKNGKKVCIISEALATINKLQVGDAIPLAFYKGYETFLENYYNPPADVYSPLAGFCTEVEPFEIIGIYRRADLWSDNSYAFTPNTIFVPNKAIKCEAFTADSGIFSTIVLENGSIDKIQAYANEAGYGDILFCYDQGYSNIKDTLADFLSTSRILLVIGTLAWIAMLILFIVLYVIRLKRTAGMMLSLGSGRKITIIHILISTLTLVLIASVISGLLGFCLVGNVTDYVYNQALSNSVNSSFSANVTSDTLSSITLSARKLPQISFVIASVQFAVFAIIIWLYGIFISGKSPLVLMRHKEN